MYIKNINELVKDQLAIKLKLLEGSTIYGKIISLDEGKGAIKLYDGTLMPAIFLSDSKLDQDTYQKFQIVGFKDNNIIIKLAENQPRQESENSIETTLSKLNIPFTEGKEIIASLMKFNQHTNDDNLLMIYKNLSFIKNFSKMNDNDILKFLNEAFSLNSTTSSYEFLITKDIVSSLQNIDADLFSFMMENDIPATLENIIKAKGFVNEKFFINTLVDKFNKLVNGESKENTPKYVLSLDEMIEKIKYEPELLKKFPNELLGKALNNSNILDYMNNNYSLYMFNSYSNDNLFKNNIIIKNKYKSSKYIDINDAKVYITVDTPYTGTVEAFLSKKNSDLNVTLKVEKTYLNLYKNKIDMLTDNLKGKGYNILNITVEKQEKDTNYLSLSDFFNETIFKELDVKV